METLMVIALIHGLVHDRPDWPEYVKEQERAYQQWSQDTGSSDKGRFLNDKLITFSVPKNEKDARKVIYWIALYQEFHQPPPKCLKEIFQKYAASIKSDEQVTLDLVVKGVLNAEKQGEKQEKLVAVVHK